MAEYERRKEEAADGIVARLERHLPGLKAGTLFREVRPAVCTGRIRRALLWRLWASPAPEGHGGQSL